MRAAGVPRGEETYVSMLEVSDLTEQLGRATLQSNLAERGVSDYYGVRDAACPISTRGGGQRHRIGVAGVNVEVPYLPPPRERRGEAAVGESGRVLSAR